jgi:hypothetical protein
VSINVESDRPNRRCVCAARQTPGPRRSSEATEQAGLRFKTRSGYNFSLPIGQIDEEIAVIEQGIEKLDAAHKTSAN